MKIDAKGYITLTPKESEEIMDLLDTLAAMSGAYDQDFTGECKKRISIPTRFYHL